MHCLINTRALKDKAAAAFVKELVEASRRLNKWTKMVEDVETPTSSSEQVHKAHNNHSE